MISVKKHLYRFSYTTDLVNVIHAIPLSKHKLKLIGLFNWL